MWGVVNGRVKEPRRAGGWCVQVGVFWHAKQKAEPYGLRFDRTETGAVGKGGGGLCDAGCG